MFRHFIFFCQLRNIQKSTHGQDQYALCYFLIVTGGKKCTTIGGRDPGKQCKFPFRFDGITYNSCTYAGNGAGETAAWCSTKVDSSGNHVGGQGKWGECPSSCSPQKTCMSYLHFTILGKTVHFSLQFDYQKYFSYSAGEV